MKRPTFVLVLLLLAAACASALAESCVWTDLGTTNNNGGLTNFNGGDGVNQAATIGGTDCRRNSTGSQYFYFNVSDAWAYQGSKRDVNVMIMYYDNGTGALTLQYDSAGNGTYYAATTIYRANTSTWRTYMWHVKDAYFGNRQNGGSDFRIWAADTFYLNYVGVDTGSKLTMDLGTTNIGNGMSCVNAGDGANQAVTIGGLNCRQNSAGSSYFYFTTNWPFGFMGNRPELYITVHYYDNGTGPISLEYDSQQFGEQYAGAYHSVGLFYRTNTNTWKCHSWHVTDAYWACRQNYGANFRIWGQGTFYLNLVYARDFQRSQRRRGICPRPFAANGTADGQPFRDLMSYPAQWPQTLGKAGTIKFYTTMMYLFTDAELQTWMPQVQGWQKLFSLECEPFCPYAGGQDAYNNQSPIWQRVINDGAYLDELEMDEPFTLSRINYGNTPPANSNAVNQTVIWMGLVRQNFPETKIASIEAYPYNSYADLQWWITTVNDICAANSIEGPDYFVLDSDWRNYPGVGSWSQATQLANWCQSSAIPFSMIYWASRSSSNESDQNWYNDIMYEGSNYQSAGLAPDRYMVQDWMHYPTATVPETQSYSFTNSCRDFFNTYAP